MPPSCVRKRESKRSKRREKGSTKAAPIAGAMDAAVAAAAAVVDACACKGCDGGIEKSMGEKMKGEEPAEDCLVQQAVGRQEAETRHDQAAEWCLQELLQAKNAGSVEDGGTKKTAGAGCHEEIMKRKAVKKKVATFHVNRAYGEIFIARVANQLLKMPGVKTVRYEPRSSEMRVKGSFDLEELKSGVDRWAGKQLELRDDHAPETKLQEIKLEGPQISWRFISVMLALVIIFTAMIVKRFFVNACICS